MQEFPHSRTAADFLSRRKKLRRKATLGRLLKTTLILFIIALIALVGCLYLFRHKDAATGTLGGQNGRPQTSFSVATPEIPPLLQKIGKCESGGRQFNPDGSVVRGKINPEDTGYYQINLDIWGATAEKRGDNLSTLAGNTDFALWLFNTYGPKEWNWSRTCWGGENGIR